MNENLKAMQLMVGALLTELGLITIVFMMLGGWYRSVHYYPQENILALSVLSLFSLVVGVALLSRADKKK